MGVHLFPASRFSSFWVSYQGRSRPSLNALHTVCSLLPNQKFPSTNCSTNCVLQFWLIFPYSHILSHYSILFAYTSHHGTSIYGGFHKWGYPNSWMVYKGKSIYKWMMTRGTPVYGTPPYICRRPTNSKSQAVGSTVLMTRADSQGWELRQEWARRAGRGKCLFIGHPTRTLHPKMG